MLLVMIVGCIIIEIGEIEGVLIGIVKICLCIGLLKLVVLVGWEVTR